VGLILVLAGLIGAIIGGILLDRTKAYKLILDFFEKRVYL